MQQTRVTFPRSGYYALAIAAFFCGFSLCFLDRSIADAVGEYSRLTPLDSLALVATQGIIPISIGAMLLYCVQRFRGAVPARWLEALMVAGCSAIGALALNEFLLKPLFGRISAWDYLHHQHQYGFVPFHGTLMRSGFPSGHTVLVAAFLYVVWRYFPRGRAFYATAMACVSIMLVAGGWHFLSEIFAGLFVGLAAGMLAFNVRPVPRWS